MKDVLGDRMKTYEKVPRLYLTRRTPVIIRADGAHFHSFTRGFERPFDLLMGEAMQRTMLELCKNIPNCVLGYTQSDEITLVLCDYKTLDTEPWFDNQVQKICSTSAALATLYFNRYFGEVMRSDPYYEMARASGKFETYARALKKGATFDARCFNLPKEEVCNCLIWRQQDATRNSIQMVAQSLFSHSELQGLSCKELQDKMMLEKGINWDKFTTWKKRGACAVRIPVAVLEQYPEENPEIALRAKWTIDTEIPIFTQNRDYIESRIKF